MRGGRGLAIRLEKEDLTQRRKDAKARKLVAQAFQPVQIQIKEADEVPVLPTFHNFRVSQRPMNDCP